jgi:hypothetical protein
MLPSEHFPHPCGEAQLLVQLCHSGRAGAVTVWFRGTRDRVGRFCHLSECVLVCESSWSRSIGGTAVIKFHHSLNSYCYRRSSDGCYLLPTKRTYSYTSTQNVDKVFNIHGDVAITVQLPRWREHGHKRSAFCRLFASYVGAKNILQGTGSSRSKPLNHFFSTKIKAGASVVERGT